MPEVSVTRATSGHVATPSARWGAKRRLGFDEVARNNDCLIGAKRSRGGGSASEPPIFNEYLIERSRRNKYVAG